MYSMSHSGSIQEEVLYPLGTRHFYVVDVQLHRFLRNAMPSEDGAKDPEDPRLYQLTT